MKFPNQTRKNSGQAALIAVLFFLFISLALIGAFSGFAALELRSAETLEKSKRSYIYAEGALEDAIYRFISAKNMPNQVSYYENGLMATTSVSDISGLKEIETAGEYNSALRKIKAVLNQGAGISFYYGTQIGLGGLEMDQNSEIRGAGSAVGNVYSNGPVDGENGAKITGDLIVGGSNSIEDVIVLGSVRASDIDDSKICGDAYYQTIDSGSLNFLNGPSNPTCPDPLTPGTAFSGSANQPLADMPISDEIMQGWKNDAEAGGVITGNCGDSGSPSCVIDDNGALSLGPKKIVGNLKLTKKQTLVLTGVLYFTGSIDMDSSSGASIKCDASFGSRSCIIISDSWIHIQNNAVFQGSGASGSYLLIISALSGCNGSGGSDCTHHSSALDLHNNASGAVFYAPYSQAYLHNGVNVIELTANKIHLSNNAIVTYEEGLAGAVFSSGPSGGYEIESWKEVP